MWKYIVSLWIASLIISPDVADTSGLNNYYIFDDYVYFKEYKHLYDLIETSDREIAFTVYGYCKDGLKSYIGPIDSVRIDSIYINK